MGLGGFCPPTREPAYKVPSQQGKCHFRLCPRGMAGSGLPGDHWVHPGTNAVPFPAPLAREERRGSARGGR